VKDDDFIIGMVAANQSGSFPTRKGFERILPVVKELRDSGMTDMKLYLHTYPGREMGGVPLIDLIVSLGLQDGVYLPAPGTYETGGLTKQELAELYNSFDLYAMPSMAEGFGIPLVESQACGVPAIATDFSAMSELCFSNWMIEPCTMIITPMMAYQALPGVDSIKNRIVYAYNHRDEMEKQGKIARKKALEYNWDTVFEQYWIPTLEHFEKRIRSEAGSIGGSSLISMMREVEANAARNVKRVPDSEGTDSVE
jgi:glycosyltransferase involved in cell wall biosynthesis